MCGMARPDPGRRWRAARIMDAWPARSDRTAAQVHGVGSAPPGNGALEHVGPVFCRRCDQLVLADEPWHLGHADDAPRAVGGEDCDLSPEHAGCSMRAARRALEAKANMPADDRRRLAFGDPGPVARSLRIVRCPCV
jgi:hypothetical protein